MTYIYACDGSITKVLLYYLEPYSLLLNMTKIRKSIDSIIKVKFRVLCLRRFRHQPPLLGVSLGLSIYYYVSSWEYKIGLDWLFLS